MMHYLISNQSQSFLPKHLNIITTSPHFNINTYLTYYFLVLQILKNTISHSYAKITKMPIGKWHLICNIMFNNISNHKLNYIWTC